MPGVKNLMDPHKGFTLIELAIVLFIVGLLMAGFLAPLAESINQERRAQTQDRLNEIKEALYGHAITNGRLPCPDCRANGVGTCPGAGTLNDGIEDFNVNLIDCAVDPNPGGANPLDILEGNLPWATLGISQFDAWESWFTYGVSDSAADIIGTGTPGTGCVGATENLATIATCAVGDITIINKGNVPAVCPLPAQVQVAQQVIAVVVSHGANITRTPGAAPGLIIAPVLCSEIENLNQDANFVSSTYINPSNNNNPLGNDDMVIWISPNVIKNKLIQAGRLP